MGREGSFGGEKPDIQSRKMGLFSSALQIFSQQLGNTATVWPWVGTGSKLYRATFSDTA